MVLLLGGTSESVEIARALTNAGHLVLVSQATEIEMSYPETPLLSVRRGRLDGKGFVRLVASRGIHRVVDASHPFATVLHGEVAAMCAAETLPLLRFERPGPALPPDASVVPDHGSAARAAFAIGKVVLLTTGSRTLTDYVEAARIAGATIWARVAPSEESRRAIEASGLPRREVEWAKGPFSVQDSVDLLRRSGAQVLVTKDSGGHGGLAEKFEAARRCEARVVVVARPAAPTGAVTRTEEVLAWLEGV
jgi:precorrin-6A/cobalt-precorrin-6A reductase